MAEQETLKPRKLQILLGGHHFPELAAQAENRQFTVGQLARRAIGLLLHIDSYPNHEIVVTNNVLALSELVRVTVPLVDWENGASNIKKQAERNPSGALRLSLHPRSYDRLASLADRTGYTITDLTRVSLWMEAKLYNMITSPPSETASAATLNELALVQSSDPDWSLKLPEGIMVRHVDIPLLEILR